MPPDIAIAVEHLSKFYQMYDRPQDRLKQAIIPRFQRLLGRPPTQYAREFWALRDVTFQVARGESLGIIGRNGSGKSTLLQMLCGTLTPAGGTVQVDGRIAALLELGSGFNPEFTGRENVYLNGSVLGLSREAIDEKYDAITRFADIGEFINQPVKTYSSGMVVRLAFAVSVSVDPDVLVVDEALAVGDMAFQQQCLQRLKDLREAGTTIVLVTHDIMLTRNYCNRVVYLDHGIVKAIGDAETVGEMYIKDTMTAPAMAAPVMMKTSEEGQGLRFGTANGAITSSRLTGSRGSGAIVQRGETLTVHLEGTIADSVNNPEFVVQLRDGRGYVIYGTPTEPSDVRVEAAASGSRVSASVEIVANLGPGDYSFSLGLVDRHGHSVATVLDKIVAALVFSVALDPRATFHGPVDLQGRWQRS
ncbi:MAG: ABC transporter ATP-binding protein [Acidobacteriota bacterium]